MRAATDGEYRRAYWHFDFVAGLDGVELYVPEQKVQFKGGATIGHSLKSLRAGGRVVTVGATTGGTPELDLTRVFLNQNVIIGSAMGTATHAMYALPGIAASK